MASSHKWLTYYSFQVMKLNLQEITCSFQIFLRVKKVSKMSMIKFLKHILINILDTKEEFAL
jgi:hypothetical protein